MAPLEIFFCKNNDHHQDKNSSHEECWNCDGDGDDEEDEEDGRMMLG